MRIEQLTMARSVDVLCKSPGKLDAIAMNEHVDILPTLVIFPGTLFTDPVSGGQIICSRVGFLEEPHLERLGSRRGGGRLKTLGTGMHKKPTRVSR